MLYYVVKQSSWYLDKSKYWIIDNLAIVHLFLLSLGYANLVSSSAICSCNSLAFCAAASAKSSPLLA